MARLLPLALVALLLATACGGKETVAPLPQTVEGDVPTETEGGDGGDGGDVEGDAAAGRDVYLANDCGTCHTLSDAGTTGTVGPSLDTSSVGFDAAVQQIANGGGGMPPYEGTLSEEEIANVAAYVVQARG